MAKKDFSSVGSATSGKIGAQLEQAMSRKGQQGTASPEEAHERKEKLTTQGRKGVKAQRINMAFTPTNHEFIKFVARATNKTMTETVNNIVEVYRNEHPDLLQKSRDLTAAAELEFTSGKFSTDKNETE